MVIEQHLWRINMVITIVIVEVDKLIMGKYNEEEEQIFVKWI